YDRVPAPMHALGADGTLIQVNEEWIRFLGYSRDEALGRPVTAFMDAETRQRYQDVEWPQLLRMSSAVREAELRLLRRTGEVVEVLLRARPEHDTAGNF